MIVMVRLEALKPVMFMLFVLVCNYFFSPLAVLEDAPLMWY